MAQEGTPEIALVGAGKSSKLSNKEWKGFSCGHIDCKDVQSCYRTKREYRQHLHAKHSVPGILACIEKSFQNKEDFEAWRNVQQRDDVCQFIAAVGAKKTSVCITRHFSCNRSGSHITQSSGRRHAKTKGSCKIGGMCPAEIILKEKSGVFNVQYFPTHFGHDKEVGHLRIPKEDRKAIADALARGVSDQRVLLDVKSRPDSLCRTNLATKQDIGNIRRALGLCRKTIADHVTAAEELLTEVADLLKCQDDNTQVMSAAVDHLKAVKRLLMSNCKESPKLTVNSPQNKNSSPQRRLYSVRQKKPRLQEAGPTETRIAAQYVERTKQEFVENMNVAESELVSITAADCPVEVREILSGGDINITAVINQEYKTLGNGLLSDRHVNEAQSMLKRDFPETLGLESTTLSEALPGFTSHPRNSSHRIVQIHHIGRSNHWVVSCCQPGETLVTVYDSLQNSNHPVPCREVVEQIERIYGQGSLIYYPDFTQQGNRYDCSVFAIAFATELCLGFDPTARQFPVGYVMRQHLFNCFNRGRLSRFL